MREQRHFNLNEPSSSTNVRTIRSDPSKLKRLRVPRAVLVATIALVLVGAKGVDGQEQPRSGDRADEIANWNSIMFRAAQVAATTPLVMTRVAAIVQGAVFDSLNGIDPRYTPLHVQPAAAPGASKRAAVVLAAYTTLVNIYPAQKPMLDQELNSSLASLNSSAAAEHSISVSRGMAWGQTVANAILTWRSTDGFIPPPPPFLGGNAVGEWRPTPPQFLPGAAPQFARMTPWVIRSPSQFRPAGPPPLTSARYAADFEEVKTLGSIGSQLRTPDQTLLARFWQSTTPNYIFNHAALALAKERRLTFSQKARLLSLLNTAMADADIACWDAKYHYVFWRPVTAIALADTDNNPLTLSDAGWTPLLITPNIPDYPSGHTSLSGAAGTVLATYFGEASSIDLVSDSPVMQGVTRSFRNISTMMAEVVDARIFGGIHYRTADVDGQATGTAVARYVLDHAFLPTR